MLPATGGEAQHGEPIEALGKPRPPGGADRAAAAEPRPRITEGLVGGRPRERRPALGQPIPRAGIVIEHRLARHARPAHAARARRRHAIQAAAPHAASTKPEGSGTGASVSESIAA